MRLSVFFCQFVCLVNNPTLRFIKFLTYTKSSMQYKLMAPAMLVIGLLFSSNEASAQAKTQPPKTTANQATTKTTTANPVQSVTLKSEKDSLAYSLGVNIGTAFKEQGIADINQEAFFKAIKETLAGKNSLSNEEAGAVIGSYFQKEFEKKNLVYKEEGEKFLSENKTKEGVVTTPSGLQYKIEKAGTGEKPAASDQVKVHYHGTLVNGTVFDSSVDRGEPIELRVNGVIQGWQEVLQLMPAGSKWKVFIPYELAYGERGSGPVIPPMSALIFDIELLEIIK